MPANLLTDDRADNDTEELETDLLGIEVKFLDEELGYFDSDKDGGEEENHRVCACGDHDTRVSGHTKRGDELVCREWRGIDAGELEVFFFDCCGVLVRHTVAKEAGFGAEERVED
jgi:hypothetical protein